MGKSRGQQGRPGQPGKRPQQGQPGRKATAGAQAQPGGEPLPAERPNQAKQAGEATRPKPASPVREEPQATAQPAQPALAGRPAPLAGVGYLLLFALGVLQGLIGSFQFSRPPVPWIAAGLAVLIFATCLGGGWGLGTFAGGLVPALGWIVAAFVLSMPRPNGSVIITATTAGEWFLYGGALACVAGSVASFFARVRSAVRSAPPG